MRTLGGRNSGYHKRAEPETERGCEFLASVKTKHVAMRAQLDTPFSGDSGLRGPAGLADATPSFEYLLTALNLRGRRLLALHSRSIFDDAFIPLSVRRAFAVRGTLKKAETPP